MKSKQCHTYDQDHGNECEIIHCDCYQDKSQIIGQHHNGSSCWSQCLCKSVRSNFQVNFKVTYQIYGCNQSQVEVQVKIKMEVEVKVYMMLNGQRLRIFNNKEKV